MDNLLVFCCLTQSLLELSPMWLKFLGLLSPTPSVTPWGQPSVSLSVHPWALRAQPDGADRIPSVWSGKSYLKGGSRQAVSASNISPRFLSLVQTYPLNSALGFAMTHPKSSS